MVWCLYMWGNTQKHVLTTNIHRSVPDKYASTDYCKYCECECECACARIQTYYKEAKDTNRIHMCIYTLHLQLILATYIHVYYSYNKLILYDFFFIFHFLENIVYIHVHLNLPCQTLFTVCAQPSEGTFFLPLAY